MSATRTFRPGVSRSRRTAALSMAAVVVLAAWAAGCAGGGGSAEEDLAAASASPSVSPSPTPSVSPSLTPGATPSPTPSPSPAPSQPVDLATETPADAAVPAPAPAPKTAAPPPAPVAPPAPAPQPAPAVQGSGTPATAGAQALFVAVNSARAAAGVAPLAYSSALESVASSWTSSMAGSGTLSHNPSHSGQIPAGALSHGENVGYAGGFADNAATIHAGWMDSAGHRENILHGGFTQVGIGYVVAADGTAWATQVFASY